MSDDFQFRRWVSFPPEGEEVVISGMAGRFPKSESISDFRDNLYKKRDLTTSFDKRWTSDHPEVPKRMSYIDNLDKMDAGYFGLHHRQADVMDPQLRQLLEVAVEAILDAGVNPSELKGTKTGVFSGCSCSEMDSIVLASVNEPQKFCATGHLRSMLPNRISYYLKLKGPSCNLDTACSSSSFAFERAFRSVRTGECENAIVLGSNVVQHPAFAVQFMRLGVLSPDGVCRVFDHDAEGYVKGEVINGIFLQRAKNSRRIYAKIINCKTNTDGYTEQGITFPSSSTQKELLIEMMQEMRMEPSQIDYYEAHGTATKIGDPEEVTTIDDAIARKRKQPLLVGSVKCNVGHSEGGSGITSIIKAAFIMEKGYIPPNIHLKKYKDGMVGFKEGRMKAVTEVTVLDNDNAIIGVNNFGFGGSNCTLFMKRFNKIKINDGVPEDDIPRLICASGRTEEAISFLLEDLTKKTMDQEYIGLLHQIFKSKVQGHFYRGYTILSKNGPIKTSWKFSQQELPLYLYFGQLTNFQNLGRYLLNFPHFRTTINKINNYMSNEKLDILDTIFNNPNKTESRTLGAFAVQIGIVDLFELLQLNPTAVYGDSLGKIISAYQRKDITMKEAIFAAIGKSSPKLLNRCQKVSEELTHWPTDGKILRISDHGGKNSDNDLFVGENFLETLGRLYEEGYNLQIHKLYPPVEFPVSRNTPMISPSIKWNHSKSWNMFQFDDYNSNNQWARVKYNPQNEHKYIEGHAIDGRNLFPATEYLNAVWEVLAESQFKSKTLVPVVFENCKFIRAVVVPPSGSVDLAVLIQRGSGYFEVTEKNEVVVTGRVYAPEVIENHETDLPDLVLEDDPKEVLETDEIYRELYLRGYNYSGLFRGIVKCNPEASVSLIQWEDNWTSFMDKMLQMKILQMNSRLLYVPVGIKRLTINPAKHTKFTEMEEGLQCRVYLYKECNVIKSGGIEITGLVASSIFKKKPPTDPVLEKYVFVPNCSEIELNVSVRIVTQLILEENLEVNLKAVEIIDDFTEPNFEYLLPLVSKAAGDIPLILADLTISCKTNLDEMSGVKIADVSLTPTSGFHLIVGSKILERLSDDILGALNPNGFILTREKIDFVAETSNVTILTEHIIPNREKLILFRKSQPSTATKFIKITSSDFGWLSQLQKGLQESNVVLYSQNKEPEGILGCVNCLRREVRKNTIRCFFMMDHNVPEFDPTIDFYRDQLEKNFAVNVYKDQKWGNYRHLVLDDRGEVEAEHFYVNAMVKGDLSSLKWLEGPLTQKIELEGDKILAYPYYSAVNFKDVMTATGRVSVDAITTNRIEQECLQGFEFSGKDINGRRVMGMAGNKCIATMVSIDAKYLIPIPDSWSLEEAATINAVYATVLYALLKVIKLRRGDSILIHSATGGVGLAALHVCLHFGCDIYLTVGTLEKRDYLKRNFPQIPDSHIGNSRDTSFKEMIKIETHGRGVDIVLNSLSEEKLVASVHCMARGGHFMDIAKYDMGNDASLRLLLLERGVSYHGIMLDHVYSQSEEGKRWIVETISEGMRLGYVKPLPTKIFGREEIEQAFRYMTTGQHVGKVLIKVRDDDDEQSAPGKIIFKGVPRFNCDPKKSYIIIGGLGGFGLELADWLFLRGVSKLVLVSRSGVQTGYQTQRIRNWESYGVTIKISTDDVTTKQGCLKLIRDTATLGAIDGIFNLAAVLKDALLEDQTPESFDMTLAPKAKTTKYLDQITRQSCPELRYFVVFSSMACGRGNIGQSNYGMANSIMERICEKRRMDGLHALAVEWGVVGDVGLVAKMQKENKELVIGGALQQRISNCLEVLDKFLRQDNTIVASMVVAKKQNDSYNSDSLVDAVAHVLGVKNIKTISQQATMAELGMDSMMGTELILLLEKDFDIYVTPKDVRNLTFARLIEIENEKKGSSEKKRDDRVQQGTDNLIQFIPDSTQSHLSVIKLPSIDNPTVTVFALAGVEGVFEPLESLTKNLKAQIYGLKYSYDKPEDTVQETAKTILPHIQKQLSKDQQFTIVGHSFGVVVALELITLLEEKGHFGKLIAIDGSPLYSKLLIQKNLPAQNESEFQTALVSKIMAMVLPADLMAQHLDKLKKCKDLTERYHLSVSLVPDHIKDKAKLEKQAIFTLYKRFKALSVYEFCHKKIKSKVYLFRAKQSDINDIAGDYGLSNVCEDVQQSTVINGNHISILHEPELYDAINKII